MRTRVTLEFEHDGNGPPDINRLLADALGEFINARQYAATYVTSRYDYRGAEWQAEKIDEVRGRLALADCILSSVYAAEYVDVTNGQHS